MASRKGHVAGPGITRTLSTTDQEHFGVGPARAQDRRNRRATRNRLACLCFGLNLGLSTDFASAQPAPYRLNVKCHATLPGSAWWQPRQPFIRVSRVAAAPAPI